MMRLGEDYEMQAFSVRPRTLSLTPGEGTTESDSARNQGVSSLPPIQHAGPRSTVSVLLPAYDEQDNIVECLKTTSRAFERTNDELELIVIDDGSADQTAERARDTTINYGVVRVLVHQFNRGKTAAIKTGFEASRGQLIGLMDADLQYDPEDLVRLVGLIKNGYGAVSGWRRSRRDHWSKTIPSRLFNWMTRQTFGLDFKDFNSGVKAFSRDALMSIQLEGDAHRFLVPLANMHGFRVVEIPVSHFPRRAGHSKFGPLRMMTGTVDLMGLKAKMTFGWDAITPFSTPWRFLRYEVWRHIKGRAVKGLLRLNGAGSSAKS